jgi:tetratricopeptide (TPR) repeat protein
MRLLTMLGIMSAALAATVLPGCQWPGSQISTDEAIKHYVKSQAMTDQQALAELAKAIKSDPTLSVAHSAMGDIYRRNGDYELARRSYENACDTNPYYFKPHYNLGVTYQLLADTAKIPEKVEEYLHKACDVYLRAIVLEPKDYDTSLNLSACYFQLGKYNQAEQYCQSAIQIDGKKAAAFSNLGAIYDSQNRLYEAVKAYKEALELDVHQPKLLMNLGSTYMRQGRLDYAIKSFQTAAKEEPANSAPWEQMGACYYRLQQYDKSLEAYQKAIALNAKSADAQRGLGVVYMTQFLTDRKDSTLRDKALAAWNASLELKADQDDLKKLVEKYTPTTTPPPL